MAKWMLGFAALLALTLGVASLQMYQISSKETGKSALMRSLAALTEIDALLDRHYAGLLTQAGAATADEALALEDFPVRVDLSREDILGQPREDLRAMILDRSANRVYDDGPGVLRESAEARGGPGRFSLAGITDGMLGQLTAANHTRYGVATILLLGVAAALCIATSSACRGMGRLTAIGVAIAGAGALVLAGGLAVMAYAHTQSGGQEFAHGGLFAVVGDLAGAPVRNGLMFMGAGAGLALVGLAAGAVTGSRSVEAAQIVR